MCVYVHVVLSVCVVVQEVESLRVQVQSQQAEISQLQSERHELQRRTQPTVSTDTKELVHKKSLQNRF